MSPVIAKCPQEVKFPPVEMAEAKGRSSRPGGPVPGVEEIAVL
jgi:hypothetical protein